MQSRFTGVLLPTLATLLASCATVSNTADKTPVDSTKPVLILRHGSSPPNSAGGVEFRAQFKNQSGKPIKYVEFTVAARNRVGDLAVDEIRRRTEAALEFTGPLEHGGIAGRPFPVRWDNVWYNTTISCAVIRKVKVIYFEGESSEFVGEAVNSLLSGASCGTYN